MQKNSKIKKKANPISKEKVKVMFSAATYKAISKKASYMGLPVNEFLRISAEKIDKDTTDYVEYLDEKSEKELAKAFDDVKHGRTSGPMSAKELIEWLDK